MTQSMEQWTHPLGLCSAVLPDTAATMATVSVEPTLGPVDRTDNGVQMNQLVEVFIATIYRTSIKIVKKKCTKKLILHGGVIMGIIKEGVLTEAGAIIRSVSSRPISLLQLVAIHWLRMTMHEKGLTQLPYKSVLYSI